MGSDKIKDNFFMMKKKINVPVDFGSFNTSHISIFFDNIMQLA